MFVTECDSTNSRLMEMVHRPDYLWTDYQTAGRGQAGNGWESERGKNILLSICTEQPEITIVDQFRMSMLFSLVVIETIGQQMEAFSGEEQYAKGELCVKWPNDIYYGDKKLAGILIEHKIGHDGIVYSVLGIGVNVNQTEWHGSAPNPTSLKLITGRSWDCKKLVEQLVKNWQESLRRLQDGSQLKKEYMQHLYRREGWYPYVEREVNTIPTMNAAADVEGQFMARIEDVTPVGELVLRDREDRQRRYHFKQIRFVV